MELSCFDVPPTPKSLCLHQYAIVEAEEGRLGMFTLYSSIEREYLQYAILRTGVGDASQWQLKPSIPLPLKRHFSIMAVAGGYMLLHSRGRAIDNGVKPSIIFSLNLKTLLLQRFRRTENNIIFVDPCLYAGFPPPLSPPRI